MTKRTNVEIEEDEKKAIVLAAIEENPWAVQFVGGDLKNDCDLASATVSQKSFLMQFFSENVLKKCEDGRPN